MDKITLFDKYLKLQMPEQVSFQDLTNYMKVDQKLKLKPKQLCTFMRKHKRVRVIAEYPGRGSSVWENVRLQSVTGR